VIEELKENREQAMRRYMNEWQDGRIKMAMIYSLLDMRHTNAALFTEGTYVPLNIEGTQSHAIIGFARHHDRQTLIVFARRFFAGRHEALKWENTKAGLPQAMQLYRWTEVLTGKEITPAGAIDIEQLLHTLPVAVLLSK
jgi:(1->4)-alpha-D-glucan 1-alpha-D-glucosylmutase